MLRVSCLWSGGFVDYRNGVIMKVWTSGFFVRTPPARKYGISISRAKIRKCRVERDLLVSGGFSCSRSFPHFGTTHCRDSQRSVHDRTNPRGCVCPPFGLAQ